MYYNVYNERMKGVEKMDSFIKEAIAEYQANYYYNEQALLDVSDEIALLHHEIEYKELLSF